jgi:hypothetical protein
MNNQVLWYKLKRVENSYLIKKKLSTEKNPALTSSNDGLFSHFVKESKLSCMKRIRILIYFK